MIIPENLDYNLLKGLRLEAQQKLNKIRPQNIGQASRISGVSPADVTILIMYVKSMEKRKIWKTKLNKYLQNTT